MNEAASDTKDAPIVYEEEDLAQLERFLTGGRA